MIPNQYSPRPGILQAVQDNAPHSLISAAKSGGGIWGKNAVDYLDPTPIELYIERLGDRLDGVRHRHCPIETSLTEADLESRR